MVLQVKDVPPLVRLFVHESCYQEVLKKLQHAYKQITIGDPLDQKNLMGPLINAKAVAQFQNAVDRIKGSGWTNSFWW